jgi:ribosome-associated toxin RatA of RatAB toxin-antitoxin module
MGMQFIVKKPISQVYKILADLKEYGRYHPIIRDVKHIEKNKYNVFEAVRMLFISFRFVYPASVYTQDSNNQVWYEANVMNLVKIKMNFRLSPVDSQNTKVIENLQIESVLPIHWYLSRLIKKCHIELFERVSKSYIGLVEFYIFSNPSLYYH